MTTKTEFLANISKRLGRSSIEAPKDSVTGSPDFWQAYQLPEAERLQKFVAEVDELGAKAMVCDSLDALLVDVQQLLTVLAPPKVLAWQGGFSKVWKLDTVLADWDVLDWNRESFLADSLHAKVGITAVDYAIADTGSLVICTDKTKPRVASLVPDVHIALVRAEQIRTRMGEVLEEIATLSLADVPSSVHFITGPSRSSDIENDLSIGVHGPAALYVFVLNEQ